MGSPVPAVVVEIVMQNIDDTFIQLYTRTNLTIFTHSSTDKMLRVSRKMVRHLF